MISYKKSTFALLYIPNGSLCRFIGNNKHPYDILEFCYQFGSDNKSLLKEALISEICSEISGNKWNNFKLRNKISIPCLEEEFQLVEIEIDTFNIPEFNDD